VRAFPLTVLNGGINRLRVKGGASASQLYDLQNGYISNAGSIVPREGTIRVVTLDSSTVGLAAANGQFNIFSSAFSTAALPANYVLNVLSNPNNTSSSPVTIFFAKPFMGFEYVVASFSDGSVFHYWLQNNGTWTSNTTYTTASIVLPPTPNGLAYQGVRDFPTQPSWTPETAITLGAFVEPNVATGFVYQAVAIAGYPSGLLFNFDGTSGSTVFVDQNGYGQTLTAHGNAQVSGAQAKFGNGSLVISSQTTDYVKGVLATGGVGDITTGDSTMECWFYPTANPNGSANYILFSVATLAGSPIIEAGGLTTGGGVGNGMNALAFSGSSGGQVATNLTPNTWNHVAISIQGANAFAFCNGVQYSTFAVGARNGSVGTLVIGAQPSGGGAGAWGFIDEFRLTKGTALYTANFTPPTTVFVPASPAPSHTGASEPVWPTIAGATLQEFGDFDSSSSDAGTTQASNSPYTTASALGLNITDRYGNSATIANSGIFTTSSAVLSSTTLASTKITTWLAGTNYAPGAVVIPTTSQGAFINAIPNGDFEGGSASGGWTFTDPGGVTQWAYSSTLPYQGSECITFPGGSGVGAGGGFATMTSYSLVTPGQSVTASAYLNPNNAGANLTLWIQLNWYDNTDAIISSSGHAQNEQEGGGYRKTTITATAPVGAAHVRVSIGAGSGTNGRNAGFADLITWNLETPSAVTNFLYEAIQLVAGSSGTAEPTWPTTLGSTILDGGVTWKAIGTSIITWQAIPLMQSGLVAPVFPTTIGNSVLDSSTFTNSIGNAINTSMSWVAIDRHVLDASCPNTTPVAIGASHVFAGNNDIVPFSAAVNPIDWSSTNNAGYLPTGLNNYGDNPVAVLALYRGNLVAFNAGGYQMWQIDPDPQNMALLDAQPVGSTFVRAAQSVANDLLFLTAVGVRNLGTVGATANMAIGNTGQPVDPLVTAYIATSSFAPLSLYYPGRGQYWLIFGSQAFVLTINGTGNRTWSRYSFPQAITDWTLNAEILYLRTANNLVWQFNPAAVGVDDSNSVLTTQGANVPFNGVVQWPYLDLAALGLNKMLVGVDIVGEGNCSIQIAYNQNDKTTFNDNPSFAVSTSVTTPYFVQIDDTVPGEPLAFPINAPSYSPILTFTGSSTSANAWTWQAMNIYFAPVPLTAAGATG
jgi:hypothetical protein